MREENEMIGGIEEGRGEEERKRREQKIDWDEERNDWEG